MRQQVALKVINPRLLSRAGAVARFRREVETVAKLSYPNVAAAFDADQVGDVLVLVTEFVDGTDLAQVVKDEGCCPSSRRANWSGRRLRRCNTPTNGASSTGTSSPRT